jgi:hypothetical protein
MMSWCQISSRPANLGDWKNHQKLVVDVGVVVDLIDVAAFACVSERWLTSLPSLPPRQSGVKVDSLLSGLFRGRSLVEAE